jgi:tRNA pseudouridine32 synthase/23S rRNA pseudouridine746 synthase/23S rRNA pseudouridine1911/1915/1917 synthase
LVAVTAIAPEDLVARILYRDALMLIVDKPTGVPVHQGPSKRPSLEDAFDALRFGLPRPPALAHRLDADTSGCLVLGRHRKALARLGRLFAAGSVEKIYWAIVACQPPAEAGRIDLPIRKIGEKARWRIVPDPTGQPAITDYRVLGRGDGLTWLELRPRTGRTHQIRVHCAALGMPVVGDPTYGRAPAAQDVALHLHARAVAVPLYPGRPPIEVVAPPPPHMRAALAACGFREEAPAPEPIGASSPPPL